jgi:hypothetical protein
MERQRIAASIRDGRAMNLLGRLFAEQEISEQPYGRDVLCANWVERPQEQPAACGRVTVLERLREADAVTFLARIYATQRC